ncbi:MAG: hypothetical protein HUU25_15415 [Candidatus Sumerlaeia bacterium]|nr:hypothetical protein [Candidatus Sumerlaeia bacterium]
MSLILSLALIVLGLLACSSLIISKKPNAKELLDKIAPFQGYIGLVLLVLGLVNLVQAILNIGVMFSSIYGIIGLLVIFVSIALGFLASFTLLGQWFGGSAAAEKGVALRAKLILYQVPLGVAGIVLGAYWAFLTLTA